MFENFFGNRIKKDIAKLEYYRNLSITTLRSNEIPEDTIMLMADVAYKKAQSAYLAKPDANKALAVYYATLEEELKKQVAGLIDMLE